MNKFWRTIPWLLLSAATLTLASSWWTEGIVFDLVSGNLTSADRLGRLKEFFNGFGTFAPLVYFLFVVVEVIVAPIPGLMLYAPGGIIFGTLMGGSLALLGNVFGAGIACGLTRSLGTTWLSRFFEAEQLQTTQTAIRKRGGWLIFLLRLNPVTSSDLVSYAAGFTKIPIWKVMLATACGMAPLCYAQAWLAEGLMTSFPWLIYPLIAVCAVYLVGVCVIIRRVLLQPA